MDSAEHGSGANAAATSTSMSTTTTSTSTTTSMTMVHWRHDVAFCLACLQDVKLFHCLSCLRVLMQAAAFLLLFMSLERSHCVLDAGGGRYLQMTTAGA